MECDIYEGRRIKIEDKNYVEISFKTRHDTMPIVTTSVEPGDGDGTMTTFVVWVTQRVAAIQFSGNFSGYLHLQAFSQRVPFEGRR